MFFSGQFSFGEKEWIDKTYFLDGVAFESASFFIDF